MPYSVPQNCSRLSTSHDFGDIPSDCLADMFVDFSVIGQALYPIEMCINYRPIDSIWFRYLTTDLVYLHSTIWASYLLCRFLDHHVDRQAALVHEQQALRLLQFRLNDVELATLDGTYVKLLLPELDHLPPKLTKNQNCCYRNLDHDHTV
jgi:hypothetical protein